MRTKMAAAEQDLLGTDETVTDEARLFPGEDKHASRTISKRFLRVAPPDSVVFRFGCGRPPAIRPGENRAAGSRPARGNRERSDDEQDGAPGPLKTR